MSSITRDKLLQMQNIDIQTVDKEELVDLCSVKINAEQSVRERMDSFLQQIKNPYCFKVGDVAVQVVFSEDGGSFSERFEHVLQTLK